MYMEALHRCLIVSSIWVVHSLTFTALAHKFIYLYARAPKGWLMDAIIGHPLGGPGEVLFFALKVFFMLQVSTARVNPGLTQVQSNLSTVTHMIHVQSPKSTFYYTSRMRS